MSKKKSLGSSPIGYSTLGMDSFEFIPTINKSEETYTEPEEQSPPQYGYQNNRSDSEIFTSNGIQKNSVEKRIVSYYLEENLVNRLKKVADEQKMYYSTLVSHAIYCWLENRGY